MEWGGVMAPGRYKQVGAGMCLPLFCDRTVFDINLKLFRAVKKSSSFAFLMAGYNSC